jgi:hypothetical protein
MLENTLLETSANSENGNSMKTKYTSFLQASNYGEKDAETVMKKRNSIKTS